MAAMAEKRQANLPAVFEHYKLPECTEGLFKAHCKHCNKELSGTTKSTTNWWKHLVSVSEFYTAHFHIYIYLF